MYLVIFYYAFWPSSSCITVYHKYCKRESHTLHVTYSSQTLTSMDFLTWVTNSNKQCIYYKQKQYNHNALYNYSLLYKYTSLPTISTYTYKKVIAHRPTTIHEDPCSCEWIILLNSHLYCNGDVHIHIKET